MLPMSSGHLRSTSWVRHSLFRGFVPRKGKLSSPAGERGQWACSLGGMDEAAEVTSDLHGLLPLQPYVFSQLWQWCAFVCLLTQKWQAWSAGLGKEICGAGRNQSIHLWYWAQRRSVLQFLIEKYILNLTYNITDRFLNETVCNHVGIYIPI